MWKLTRKEIASVISDLGCRLVLFREPYNQFSDPVACDLFCKLMRLKMTGYRRKHDQRVLPIDTYDYLATHIALCVSEKDGSLKPINAYKSISSRITDQHVLPFPAISLLNTCSEKLEAKRFERRLVGELGVKEVFYNGSWTMDETYKNNERVRQFLQEATLATLVQYYAYQKRFPVISGAVTRFGVDRWKETVGFEDIYDSNGDMISRFHSPVFSNSELRFMVLNRVSDEGLLHAKDYSELWDHRIELESDQLALAA